MVALTLSFYLMRGRSDLQKYVAWRNRQYEALIMLSIRESNSRINLIMLYAVNTGAITGCVRPKTQVCCRGC